MTNISNNRVGSTGSRVVGRPAPIALEQQAAVALSPPSTNTTQFRHNKIQEADCLSVREVKSLVEQAAKSASEAKAAAVLAAQSSETSSKLAAQVSLMLFKELREENAQTVWNCPGSDENLEQAVMSDFVSSDNANCNVMQQSINRLVW